LIYIEYHQRLKRKKLTGFKSKDVVKKIFNDKLGAINIFSIKNNWFIKLKSKNTCIVKKINDRLGTITFFSK